MGTNGPQNAAIFTLFGSMGILPVGGYFANHQVPPVPEKVVRSETALADRARGRSPSSTSPLANRLADHFGVPRAVLLDA